jgi:diguanylate cyclase (GGDEF)-like protein
MPVSWMIVIASGLAGGLVGLLATRFLPADLAASLSVPVGASVLVAVVSAMTWVRLRGSDTDNQDEVEELQNDLVHEIELRKRAEAALEFHVEKDSLTQLATSRYFISRSELALARARRAKTPTTLLLLSVDNFDNVAERLGPVCGDDVLRKIAQICKESVREVDLPARLDDRAFAIVLEDTDADDARVVINRIRSKISETESWSEGRTARITVGMGLIEINARHHFLNDALKWARQALEHAQSQGPGKICIARDAGDEGEPDDLEISNNSEISNLEARNKVNAALSSAA